MLSRLPHLKIGGKSVAFVTSLLAITALFILAVGWMQIRSRNEAAALQEARTSLRTLAVLFATTHGEARLSYADGRLGDTPAPAMPTFSDHTLVDRTVDAVGGNATIFVTDERGQFVRRTTNVKTENGSRAVGTVLAPHHPAQPLLKAGQPYYSAAVLFGRSV